VLVARVEAALESASDLPADSISVTARGGVVTLIGSVVCDECGGSRTPSGTGTVQQSLGAVVRAVPGVQQVLFDLVYQRP
jgi:osmotically-inducible protein OsmY